MGSNETGFNQYGSNMSLGLDLDKGTSASCDSEGRSMLISPAAEEGGLPTPVHGLAIGGGRLHKKTAGRKTPPVAPTSPPSVRAGTPVSHRTAVMALASLAVRSGGTGRRIPRLPPTLSGRR